MTNVIDMPRVNQLQQLIDDLNKEFAVVPVGAQIRILWESKDPVSGLIGFRLLRLDDFKLLTKNRMAADADRTSVADFFLQHPKRRQFMKLDFIPGPTPDGVYNLWKGFPVTPVKGDCSMFWALVQDVICAGDKKAYSFVRKWLAHIFQKPAELPGTAIVMVGAQGIGKNTFADTIGKLLGENYLPVTSLEQITGHFNSHLANKLLLHANEAIWGGNKQAEGALKALITDPFMAVEGKGKDIVMMNNYKRMIASSNEQWAVPRGVDDRRFFVLEVSDKHKEDHEYFRAICEQLDRGGLPALMYDLQNEALGEFNPRVMPATSAGLDMKLQSASSVVRWAFELVHEEYDLRRSLRVGHSGTNIDTVTGGSVDKDELFDHYIQFCRAANHVRAVEKSQFYKQLKIIIPDLRAIREKVSDGGRQRMVVLPALEKAQENLEKHLKQVGTISWPSSSRVAEASRTPLVLKNVANTSS